jgi:hypothetical protein
MKKTLKTPFTFFLLILFFFACGLALIIIFGAAWLHTYKVFTSQTPVAEITISEQKEDALGPYADVTVRQVKGRSPLSSIFNPYDKSDDDLLNADSYKLYGDYVEIGGPIIKFKDFLTLFNFKTVYKIALLNAAYVSDIELERNRTAEMFSRIELNGGFASWKSVQEDVQSDNFRGKLIKAVIDSIPQIDPKGVFVTKQEQVLTLCVTDKGFFFCDRDLE